MAQFRADVEYGETKGWLYELWNGQFKVRKGVVRKTQWCSKREAIFRYGYPDDDWVRCSAEPGKMMQAKLWLPERDDIKARNLLIEYYEGNIEKLERQIEGYRHNIRILRAVDDED